MGCLSYWVEIFFWVLFLNKWLVFKIRVLCSQTVHTRARGLYGAYIKLEVFSASLCGWKLDFQDGRSLQLFPIAMPVGLFIPSELGRIMADASGSYVPSSHLHPMVTLQMDYLQNVLL